MNMAFGDQVSCTVKDLFKNYEFSDDVYKHAKKADQDAIRSLGSKAQARFDTAVNQVARDVHRKVEDLHLPSYYRPWSRNLCHLCSGEVLCSLFNCNFDALVYASALQWCL